MHLLPYSNAEVFRIERTYVLRAECCTELFIKRGHQIIGKTRYSGEGRCGIGRRGCRRTECCRRVCGRRCLLERMSFILGRRRFWFALLL